MVTRLANAAKKQVRAEKIAPSHRIVQRNSSARHVENYVARDPRRPRDELRIGAAVLRIDPDLPENALVDRVVQRVIAGSCVALHKWTLYFDESPSYLSRACLGKMIIFIRYKKSGREKATDFFLLPSHHRPPLARRSRPAS